MSTFLVKGKIKTDFVNVNTLACALRDGGRRTTDMSILSQISLTRAFKVYVTYLSRFGHILSSMRRLVWYIRFHLWTKEPMSIKCRMGNIPHSFSTWRRLCF